MPLNNLIQCLTILIMIFFFLFTISVLSILQSVYATIQSITRNISGSNFILLQNLLLLSLHPVSNSDVRGAQRAGSHEAGHHRISLGSRLVVRAREDFVQCFGHGLSIAPTEELTWGVSFAIVSQEGQGLHVYFSGTQIWYVLLLFSLRLMICNQVLRTLLFLQSPLYSQKGRQIPSQTLGKDYWCLNFLQYVKSWTVALELANAHAGTQCQDGHSKGIVPCTLFPAATWFKAFPGPTSTATCLFLTPFQLCQHNCLHVCLRTDSWDWFKLNCLMMLFLQNFSLIPV